MDFIKRLGYYLIGFSVGLIFLFYFFNGKRTQCNYSPQTRVLNDLSKKKWILSENINSKIKFNSTEVSKWISLGSINFSKSDTNLDSCKIYCLVTIYKNIESNIYLKNCEQKVTILEINSFIPSK